MSEVLLSKLWRLCLGPHPILYPHVWSPVERHLNCFQQCLVVTFCQPLPLKPFFHLAFNS